MDINKFKQYFMSIENINTILDIVYTKLLNSYEQFDSNILNHMITDLTKTNLYDILNNIFEQFFMKMINMYKSAINNKVLEDVLTNLNKLVIKRIIIHIDKEIQEKTNMNQPIQLDKKNKEIKQSEQIEQIKQSEIKQLEQIKQSQIKQLEIKQSELIKQSEQIKQLEQEYYYKSHHFIANEQKKENNLYVFSFFLSNVSSINLDTISIICNVYNINQTNNNFNINIDNIDIKVSIPFGYYNIDELTEIITIIVNKKLLNSNIQFTMYKNKNKNKIYASCINADNKPIVFNMIFPNKISDNSILTLNKLLGFKNEKYLNNNMYISEKYAINNIFNDLYLNIYINNILLEKNTTSNNIKFYQHLNINDYILGKKVNWNIESEPYDFTNKTNIKTVAFELLTYENIEFSEFDVILNFEYQK